MDSLYGSMALYGGGPVLDSYNFLIEIARWTAPFTTATVLLCAVRRWGNRVKWFFQSLSSKSIVVYCDTDMKISTDEKQIKPIYPGRNLVKGAKKQIIMLKSDTESLIFYEKNRDKLKDTQVYIGLKEMEYGLMKNQITAPVSFFDINGSIARMLWKKIGLWRSTEYSKPITVSILGDGHLGQAILNYGLLLNLYSSEQEISYYLIGDTHLYQSAHGNIETCNQDRVVYCDSGDKNIIDVITDSDYIIVSKQLTVEQLQTVGVLGLDKYVYYYAPEDGDAGEYLELSNLNPFGRDRDIFTYENVCKEKMLQKAKEINFQYVKDYNGSCDTLDMEWQKLNGFLKWSNISAADYNEILAEIVARKEYGQNEKLDELAELEHIRWCRFHYLNYWKYGIPKNGKNKDEDKRIHACLCAYSELDEENREKDRIVVRQICGWKTNEQEIICQR